MHPDVIESVEAAGAGIGALSARHFERAFREMMKGPQVVQTASYLRLATGEPHPMGNVAIVSEPGDVAAALEATTPLAAGNAPCAAIFPRGVNGVVAAAVKALGFGIEAGIPAMAVDIDRMAATTLPAGYEWTRVGNDDTGRAWTETFATGYGLPRALAGLFSPDNLGADMAADAAVQFFAITRDGRPVATSLLYLADGVAGIYNVATLPEERKKGLGAHATAEALRVARALGYRVGVLQSSSAGYPVYVKLGFGDHLQIPMLIRMPG